MAKIGSPTAPEVKAQIAAGVAQGHTYAQIAANSGVTVWTVRKIVAEPQTRAFIEACRAVVKEKSARALVENTAALSDVIKTALAKVDLTKITAKDIDALSRAALNMEKIAASVAGDSKPAPTERTEIIIRWPDWAMPHSSVIIPAEPVKALPPADDEWDGEVIVPESNHD
jgi:hypothetical protein